MISDSRVSRVAAPIAPGDRGDAVAKLQAALTVLVELGVFRAEVAPNRPSREELNQPVAALAAVREEAGRRGGSTRRAGRARAS